MASRLKEDEKNERIIRGLLKLPGNRKCINCNSMGPQYVCTTFCTFVCTTCSGIHREFTHRVKSVSMAKFTPQEVSSLQSGGNGRAKEIYFKELDPLRHVPDNSNVDRLRDYIKHVYVDRRYMGERSNDKPPTIKMGDRDEPSDYKRTDSYGSGSSRSPPYDTSERRYSDRPSPGYGGRSPGYDRNNQQNSDYGRSPVHTGSPVVNDWRREDRFGNGRRSEDQRRSEGDSMPGNRSPDSQKDVNLSSPPMIRPVREILGENASPLRVVEPPKVTSSRMREGFAHTQRTASSSSLGSSNGNPSEIKREDSLIDFGADTESPATVATQPNESVANLSSTTNSDNWACFDNAPEPKVSQPVQNLNTVDSLFTQLSVPSSASFSGFPSAAPPSNNPTPAALGDSLFASAAQVSMTSSHVTSPALPASNASLVAPNGAYAAAANNPALPTNSAGTSIDTLSSIPSGGAPPAIPGLTSTLPVNGVAGQWSNLQSQQQSIYPGSGSQLTVSQFTSSFTGASSSQELFSQSISHVPQAGIVPTPAPSGVVEQPVEVKASGRKELPADIFTVMYAPQPVRAYGWQTGFPTGMSFPVQYNTQMPMQHFSQQAKSVNPFDISGESHTQAPAFPSMMPLQNALPNMTNTTGLVRTSSLGTATPSWMPSQTPAYPSTTPQFTPSFAHTFVPSGIYMNQQVPSNLAPRPQGFGGYGNDVTSYSSTNATLSFGGISSAPTAPSSSRNPFG